MAALETQLMADLAQQSGDVVDMIVAEEKTRNRKLLKALVWSLYYLIKHHTTNFEDLISLQADNENELLRLHLDTCPSNATYLSRATTAELLKSISHQFENDLLTRLKASPYYSIMADESTDTSSKEELSVCARWIEDGKAVEHFLGIVHAPDIIYKYC